MVVLSEFALLYYGKEIAMLPNGILNLVTDLLISKHGLCKRYSKAFESIASQGPGFFFQLLLSGSSSNIHI